MLTSTPVCIIDLLTVLVQSKSRKRTNVTRFTVVAFSPKMIFNSPQFACVIFILNASREDTGDDSLF